VNTNFSIEIVLCNDAHFHLDGFINHRICRIWGSESQYTIFENQMYLQFVTVWCEFMAGGVVGPRIVQDETGQAVTRLDVTT